mmetsp:Transcript_62956/g.144882  ORF Transcript_62956/g.144882 Transcript_62956/m.144882 type:complete len:220 (+) Transcript_62956:339-998(+)
MFNVQQRNIVPLRQSPELRGPRGELQRLLREKRDQVSRYFNINGLHLSDRAKLGVGLKTVHYCVPRLVLSPSPPSLHDFSHLVQCTRKISPLGTQIPKLLLHPSALVVDPAALRAPILLYLCSILHADLEFPYFRVVQPHLHHLNPLPLGFYLLLNHLLECARRLAGLCQALVPHRPMVRILLLEPAAPTGVGLEQLRRGQQSPILFHSFGRHAQQSLR